MMFAHGGTAGLLVELSVLLVPLLCILILLWWGKRHAGPRQNRSPGDPGGEEGGP